MFGYRGIYLLKVILWLKGKVSLGLPMLLPQFIQIEKEMKKLWKNRVHDIGKSVVVNLYKNGALDYFGFFYSV